MPPLADPQVLACFQELLENWYVTDFVTAKDQALEWIGKNLSGLDLKGVAKLMHEHIQAGGTINQVHETRPEWNDRDYHYDFRLPIHGRLRYIETILVDDNPKNPYIHIVSMHDA